VKLGWGVSADLSGVKIEDDPAISKQPFVTASDVYARVDLIPLLSRHIHVAKVTMENPQVRIIRTADGTLNVASIGKKGSSKEAPATPMETSPSAREGASNPSITAEQGNQRDKKAGNPNLNSIYVNSLEITGGVIVFEDRTSNAPPVTIKDAALTIKDFSL